MNRMRTLNSTGNVATDRFVRPMYYLKVVGELSPAQIEHIKSEWIKNKREKPVIIPSNDFVIKR